MNFLSIPFLLFLLFFVVTYYITPNKYRYINIFLGSYFFYGYNSPIMLLILVLITIISYIGGMLLSKKKKKSTLLIFFLSEILILVFFKYTTFLLQNLYTLSNKFNWELGTNNLPNIMLPIGLSFMIFQACTYLTDIYNEKVTVEKNLIRFASFIAFFPTVLSGPIQKSRTLLPQLRQPASFEYNRAVTGTILFIWGMFEKAMISNRLLIIVNSTLNDYNNHSSAEILIAVICFSFYIYADFSSYSDMARGVGFILGIDVGKNFNNPYLSTSTSEFWNRWHMSLNEWFIDNIYIPLGGNRKGTLRKYLNVFIVFFISGLWHGASWHFVIWGVINGFFVIFGQIIKPHKKNLYEKLHIDYNASSILICRRIIVFVLISFTWIFFNKGFYDSLMITKRIIRFNYLSLFDPNIFNIGGTVSSTFVSLILLIVFCFIQIKRAQGERFITGYISQPVLLQCIPLALIICICIFASCQTNAAVDSNFLYFQF